MTKIIRYKIINNLSKQNEMKTWRKKYVQYNSYKTTGQIMEEVQLIYSLIRLVSMNCISHRSVNGWMYIFHI